MSRRVAAALLAGTAIGVAFDSVGPLGRRETRSAGSQPPIEPAGPNRVQPEAALRGATVRVSARGCGGSVIGSGTWLAPAPDRSALLVTNSHVVDGATSVEVDLSGSTSMVVVVVGTRPDVDLAFATGRHPGTGPALTPADADPALGDRVLLAGHGGGGGLSVLDGTVTNVVDGRSYGSAGPVLLLDRDTTGGFSGGPVVDLDGRLVGVLRAHDRATGLTVAVPVSMVVEAARSAAMHRGQTRCS